MSVVEDLRAQKDAAYAERNRCVQLIAKLAISAGWRAWLGMHEKGDPDWDPEWYAIVFIELPTGQVSWHLHDSEVNMFDFLPRVVNGSGSDLAWDGHTTAEKYDRMRRWVP